MLGVPAGGFCRLVLDSNLRSEPEAANRGRSEERAGFPPRGIRPLGGWGFPDPAAFPACGAGCCEPLQTPSAPSPRRPRMTTLTRQDLNFGQGRDQGLLAGGDAVLIGVLLIRCVPSTVVADVLSEFLEVAVHLILYVREVYPVGIFQKRKKYNVPVQVSPSAWLDLKTIILPTSCLTPQQRLIAAASCLSPPSPSRPELGWNSLG